MKRILILGIVVSGLQAAAFVPTAQAHFGFGICADSQGQVYFLDSVRNRVWKIDQAGRLNVLVSGKHGNNLVADGDGNLYVENFNQSLWKITPAGKATEVILPRVRQNRVGALDELVAVAGDTFYFVRGNDFVGRTQQIVELTPDGRFSLLAGGTPGYADGKGDEARFTDIRAAAWGPDGALYVTDGPRVRRVGLDGTVTTLASLIGAGNPPRTAPGVLLGIPVELLGIAVDRTGDVYVADVSSRSVRKITPRGEVFTVATSEEPWTPVGVALGGGVYVLERWMGRAPVHLQAQLDTPRVRKIGPNGEATVVAVVQGSFLDGVLAMLPWPILAGFVLLVFSAAVVFVWWVRRRRIAGQAVAPAT